MERDMNSNSTSTRGGWGSMRGDGRRAIYTDESSKSAKPPQGASSSSNGGSYNRATKQKSFEVPKPISTESERFPMDRLEDALAFMDKHGYAILSSVITQDEVSHGINLMWNFVEGLGVGIKRDDASTWETPDWPDPFGYGTVVGDGAGQSEFMWYCRGNDNVQQIYRSIWKTKDLITSFDGFCLHRATEYNAAWRTNDKLGFHLDQNGKTKPGKTCVQGFLNFFEAGLDDGGLVLVPGSHKIFNEIFKAHQDLGEDGSDFVRISAPSIWNGEIKRAGLFPIKVCCRPGDFVIWDSRTIHCAAPSRTLRPMPNNGVLPPRRLVAFVCMTPAERLNQSSAAWRVRAYKEGHTTSHWPEEAVSASKRRNSRANYKPTPLNESESALVPINRR